MNPSLPLLVLAEDNPDDELLSRRAIAQSKTPCKLIVKQDGPQALSYLIENGHSADLILLDYDLPGLNGREILTQLRQLEATRFTPIIMFSGSDNDNNLADCYRHGANSFVRKAQDPSQYLSDLALVVRYWLSVNHSCRNSMILRPVASRSLTHMTQSSPSSLQS
jgi:CheY-like chemotaxis protein